MSLPAGPWATGAGPLPGTRPDHALDVVLGELGAGHVPFLPELPERGVGADAIGRSASFLVDLPVDLPLEPFALARFDRWNTPSEPMTLHG